MILTVIITAVRKAGIYYKSWKSNKVKEKNYKPGLIILNNNDHYRHSLEPFTICVWLPGSITAHAYQCLCVKFILLWIVFEVKVNAAQVTWVILAATLARAPGLGSAQPLCHKVSPRCFWTATLLKLEMAAGTETGVCFSLQSFVTEFEVKAFSVSMVFISHIHTGFSSPIPASLWSFSSVLGLSRAHDVLV